MNVLDLGFFNSIQSLQYKHAATNIDDLVKEVDYAFQSVPATSLTNNFITLQKVFNEIMNCNGNNDFKLPHLHKAAAKRTGKEITEVFCDEETLRNAKKFLQGMQGSESAK